MIEFTFGTLVGALACVLLLRHLANRMIRRLIEESEVKPKNIEITVEEIDGVFFLYQVDNNRFLAQGRDLEELRVLLRKILGEQFTAVISGDNDVVNRFRATENKTAN